MSAARQLVDLDLRQDEVEVQNRTLARRPKRKRIPATVKVCTVAAVCVALALLYLHQQVSFYYLNMELTELVEEVNQLEQRNDHLMLNLESQRSLEKIEFLARTNLGMVEPNAINTLVMDSKTSPPMNLEGRWIDNSPDAPANFDVFTTLAAWFNKAFPIGGVEAGTLRR